MPYGPNTSRTQRLPHNFFERMYADIIVAEDIINSHDNGEGTDPPNLEDVLAVLRRMTDNLKRQRHSHLGSETL